MPVPNLIVRCKRCGEPANLTRKDPTAAGYTLCETCKAIVATRKK
jgi:formylmethanofuran dehydrogenase subunit E